MQELNFEEFYLPKNIIKYRKKKLKEDNREKYQELENHQNFLDDHRIQRRRKVHHQRVLQLQHKIAQLKKRDKKEQHDLEALSKFVQKKVQIQSYKTKINKKLAIQKMQKGNTDIDIIKSRLGESKFQDNRRVYNRMKRKKRKNAKERRSYSSFNHQLIIEKGRNNFFKNKMNAVKGYHDQKVRERKVRHFHFDQQSYWRLQREHQLQKDEFKMQKFKQKEGKLQKKVNKQKEKLYKKTLTNKIFRDHLFNMMLTSTISLRETKTRLNNFNKTFNTFYNPRKAFKVAPGQRNFLKTNKYYVSKNRYRSLSNTSYDSIMKRQDKYYRGKELQANRGKSKQELERALSMYSTDWDYQQSLSQKAMHKSQGQFQF